MAKKELLIKACPEITNDSCFIRAFQEQLLLLLRKRGMLVETQYRRALEFLEENQ